MTADTITDVRARAVSGVMGRRYRGRTPQQRRVDQRQRMIRAAIDEFAARGYHKTSVEDIVRSARTSRSAFYALFDDRTDVMYAAVHFVLHELVDTIRKALGNAEPTARPTEVVVRSLVEFLVDDLPAARIVLLEAAGTSPQVNALRSRLRLELAELLIGLGSSDNERGDLPEDDAVRAGILGLLFEPLAHLAQTNRLADARSHIPALVAAVDRLLR